MNLNRTYHWEDNSGNPAGGLAVGPGLTICWQDGPIPRIGNPPVKGSPNGAFVEDAIEAAIDRLEYFQRTKFAHQNNAESIQHLKFALDALSGRAAERASRGVLGKNEQ